jgi:dihydrofolate reductase
MRDLIVTENVTVDGVVDATEGWFMPTGSEDEVDAAELTELSRQHRDGADAVLLGRITYADFEGYWPKRTDDRTGLSDYLDRTMKYVVSSTLTETTWENTTVLRGPLADEVESLKKQPGKAIVATGSITLVQALTRAVLVDEYRLFVYPVVLGRGRRLFEDLSRLPSLRLVEARPFASGIVLLRYRPS